jgi:hypothetical protein
MELCLQQARSVWAVVCASDSKTKCARVCVQSLGFPNIIYIQNVISRESLDATLSQHNKTVIFFFKRFINLTLSHNCSPSLIRTQTRYRRTIFAPTPSLIRTQTRCRRKTSLNSTPMRACSYSFSGVVCGCESAFVRVCINVLIIHVPGV